MDFRVYLQQFEELVVERGIKNGCLGKAEKVSVRDGRLSSSHFGRLVGKTAYSDDVFAVDYYGHTKKSAGFIQTVEELNMLHKQQVKLLLVPLVFFASIRVEKVARLAPNLVAEFPKFKKMLLDARGFHHSYEV